jgi:glucose/arabinose dehydrogenase
MTFIRTLALLVLCALGLAVVPSAAQPLPALRSVAYLPEGAGVSQLTGMVQDPTDPRRQFVLEQRGVIRVVEDGTLLPAPFLTVPVRFEREAGLLGLAFAPDYFASRRLFVCFVRPDGQIVLARFLRSAADPRIADAASRFDLVFDPGQPFIPHASDPSHYGGKILFGSDGFLYLGTGDGGGRNDPPNNAQHPASLLGKLLRIDVNVPDSDPKGYRIPPDNPFVGADALVARDEIWAFGLRNPWRFTEDRPDFGGTGAFFIGDVGEQAFEEVNYQPPGAGKRNYGWSVFEGIPPTPGQDPSRQLAYGPHVLPFHQYPQPTGVGSSITGGYVYRGGALGAMYRGRYFFGDFSGTFFSVGVQVNPTTGEATQTDLQNHTTQLALPAGKLITSIDIDLAGELYIVTYQGGIYRVTLAEGDSDGDGLPDAWESANGLNPAVSSGSNGAFGDLDGGGLSNGEELRLNTEPDAVIQSRHFAEGASNFFFSTRFAVANPNAFPARVNVRMLKSDGSAANVLLPIGADRRATLDTSSVPGLQDAIFSTVIESDVPVVAERTMTWGAGGYGSHSERSAVGPSTTWHFAEGNTSPFNLFYLLENPQAAEAVVDISYLLQSGSGEVQKQYRIAPRSRQTILVNSEDQRLAATGVSAVIQSNIPIVAERAMYLDTGAQIFGAGHGSLGVTAPSASWFFGEGATGTFFDLFLLLANPGNDRVTATVTYLLEGGQSVSEPITLEPRSRQGFHIDPRTVGGVSLDNRSVAMRVTTAGGGIIAERAMWFGGPTAAFWNEAHNSAGATAAVSRWVVADGENGGPQAAETFVLIANTAPTATTATIKVLRENAAPFTRSITLPAESRTNVRVHPEGGFPLLHERFAVVVAGVTGAQLVVERSTYTNANGIVWSAGTNALGTELP